ncbi:MAG TPA: rhodanese-like domain-containing protein [Salinimicrobium sp.]|nr:rhodanese-like domain-containing protein [Salinimicrobium sp.]
MKIIKLLPVIVLFIATTISCEAQQKKGVKIISPEEAKTAMAAEEELVLVDVRTPEEFAEGNIEGAKNINIYDADFEAQMQQLDKEKPVYIYCRSGARSAKAANQLQEMGFKEIYDIEGGFLNWAQ